MKKKINILLIAVLSIFSLNLSAKVTFQNAKDIKQRVVPGAVSDKILSYYDVIKGPQNSIVNISTTKKVYINNQLYNLYRNPFFRDFFGQNFNGRMPKNLREEVMH